ncbi:MAG: glycosyltransferase, partial [Alphaproteobacteria bacterium]|nr:glycosyltransferase [Alphaproteobacteria bacterium]
MKKISIIVPVYNAEKTINRCVDSLLAQTHSELEVILVNDGSKDNSLNMCMEYQKKYDNVFVFTKDNSGVSDTRNLGLKHATGTYVQFVDC